MASPHAATPAWARTVCQKGRCSEAMRGHRLGSLAFKPSIAWQVSPNHRLTTHDQPRAPLGQPIKGSESLTHFEAKDSDPLMRTP